MIKMLKELKQRISQEASNGMNRGKELCKGPEVGESIIF